MMGLDKRMKKAWYRQEWKVLMVYQLAEGVGTKWKEGLSMRMSSNR